MFRLNLSTRPFYNERAVHLVLALLAILLVVVTVFNAREVVRLSGRQTALRAGISADEAKAADLRQRAAALRAQLRTDDLERVLAAAREANTLIDRRTFSWTELFNHLEATLPAGVMLTAVSPRADEEGMKVGIGVLGRRVEDVEDFIVRLEATGVFSEMLSQSETPEESGLVRVRIQGRYHPESARPAGHGGATPSPTPARAAARPAEVRR